MKIVHGQFSEKIDNQMLSYFPTQEISSDLTLSHGVELKKASFFYTIAAPSSPGKRVKRELNLGRVVFAESAG